MVYAWAVGLCLINAVWLSLVLWQLPGNWLMIATAALASFFLTDPPMITPAVFIVVIAIAMLAEAVEFLAGMLGAKKAGSSKSGALGACLGGIAGAMIGTAIMPVVGSLFGVALGAFSGSLLLEMHAGKEQHDAVRVGLAAGIGGMIGMLSKLTCGILIWSMLAIAAFWP